LFIPIIVGAGILPAVLATPLAFLLLYVLSIVH
jgi:hypothetical protein